MRVLFVCTANVCRSPLASALFAKSAHIHGASTAVSASAGLLPPGRLVDDHVVRLASDRGIDISGRLSRAVTEDLAVNADVILAMTSAHARGVVSRAPSVIRKVYTFRHFAAVVTPRPAGTSVAEWLGDIDNANRRSYVGDDDMIDIPDPIGEPFSAFETLADELESSIDWIMGCATPVKAAKTA